MIREAHERPEGMDEGTLVMSPILGGRLVEAINLVRAHVTTGPFCIPADYGSADVSRKVVRIIFSYIDYINRTVWFKQN